MTGGWLPPEAPGAGQAPPRRWDRPEAAAPAPSQQPQEPTPAPAFSQPPRGHEPSNGQAVAGLVCGILGLTVLLGTAGLAFVVSLPLSICAWVFGIKGQRRADRGEAGHRGLGQAGWIMGLIGTILGVLAMIGWILLFALNDDLIEELERELEKNESFTVKTRLLGAAARLAAGL